METTEGVDAFTFWSAVADGVDTRDAERRARRGEEVPVPKLGPVLALVVEALGGNRMDRSLLVRTVLEAARKLGAAELQRRARWG